MSAPAHEQAKRLIDEARAARARWDLVSSTNTLFAALKLAQQGNAYAAEHVIWMDLATTQRAGNDHAAALTSLLSAESAATSAGDTLAFLRARMRRCACLVGLGRGFEAATLQVEATRAHSDTILNQAVIGTEIEVGLLMNAGSRFIDREPAKALAAFERVLALEPGICAERTLASACSSLGAIHEGQGRYREAVAMYERVAEVARRLVCEELMASAKASEARCKARLENGGYP